MLTADPTVASMFLGIFSIGIAIGSVVVNRLLKNQVSARFAPISVIVMGGFLVLLYFIAENWDGLSGGQLYDLATFMSYKGSWGLLLTLLGMAVAGGMFVVPLYAFLTTTVDLSQTARTIAANNIVNSGGMVLGSIAALAVSMAGVTTTQQLLLIAAMCLIAAYLGQQLHLACDDPVTGEAVKK